MAALPILAVFALGAVFPALATAQPVCDALKGSTVSWIVPAPPGGSFDVLARLIEPGLEGLLGFEMVIQNAPGASGEVAARVLMNATPDGRTLGMLNGPTLLQNHLADPSRPDPLEDFVLLAQVDRSQRVWAVGKDSPFHSIEDLMMPPGGVAAVMAVTSTRSQSFFSRTIISRLLDVEIGVVAGYQGSRNTALAAVRGDADLVSFDVDSLRPLLEAGDLRPVLQEGDQPIDSSKLLENVPVLGGPDGLAARRAKALGREPAAAVEAAATLSDLLGGGRWVAAPRGLPEPVRTCLAEGLRVLFVEGSFQKEARATGRELGYLGPDALTAKIRRLMKLAGEQVTEVAAARKAY